MGSRADDRYRVFTLRHGTRRSRRAEVFLDYAGYDEPDGVHIVDYYFWVIQNDDRAIVVDTGFDAEVARKRGRTVLHDPVAMLEELLGLHPEDVETVVVTHSHYDHVGNLRCFPNAQVFIAEAELDFIRSGALRHRLVGHYSEPAEVAALVELQSAGRLSAIADDAWIAPGVRVIPVGGHTPGQLMIEVETDDGTVLLASDALHFAEELERDMPFISSMDVPATYRTFELIRARMAAGVRHVVPGHDARALDAMTAVAEDVAVLG